MIRGRYTVNEVEERTKVPASTLRQWERRYGFPKPERSGAGYRLYCEEDIRNIELMKRHIAEGVSASRAAELVCYAETAETELKSTLTTSLPGLRAALLDALIGLDEARADYVFGQAYSFYSVEAVLVEVAQHTMVKLGTLWHQGKVSVTTEHFASNYLQGRVRTLMSATPNPGGVPSVIVACAPFEQHELGSLILAALLRRAGYYVYYLGADTPVQALSEMARELHPAGVMVSASSSEAVAALRAAKQHLTGMAPIVAYGGAAFNREPELVAELAGTFLAADAVSAVKRFADLVQARGVLHA